MSPIGQGNFQQRGQIAPSPFQARGNQDASQLFFRTIDASQPQLRQSKPVFKSLAHDFERPARSPSPIPWSVDEKPLAEEFVLPRLHIPFRAIAQAPSPHYPASPVSRAASYSPLSPRQQPFSPFSTSTPFSQASFSQTPLSHTRIEEELEADMIDDPVQTPVGFQFSSLNQTAASASLQSPVNSDFSDESAQYAMARHELASPLKRQRKGPSS
jgi:hypothetical protein